MRSLLLQIGAEITVGLGDELWVELATNLPGVPVVRAE